MQANYNEDVNWLKWDERTRTCSEKLLITLNTILASLTRPCQYFLTLILINPSFLLQVAATSSFPPPQSTEITTRECWTGTYLAHRRAKITTMTMSALMISTISDCEIKSYVKSVKIIVKIWRSWQQILFSLQNEILLNQGRINITDTMSWKSTLFVVCERGRIIKQIDFIKIVAPCEIGRREKFYWHLTDFNFLNHLWLSPTGKIMSVLFVLDTAAPVYSTPPPINIGGISQQFKQCQPMHDTQGGREFSLLFPAPAIYGIITGGCWVGYYFDKSSKQFQEVCSLWLLAEVFQVE